MLALVKWLRSLSTANKVMRYQLCFMTGLPILALALAYADPQPTATPSPTSTIVTPAADALLLQLSLPSPRDSTLAYLLESFQIRSNASDAFADLAELAEHPLWDSQVWQNELWYQLNRFDQASSPANRLFPPPGLEDYHSKVAEAINLTSDNIFLHLLGSIEYPEYRDGALTKLARGLDEATGLFREAEIVLTQWTRSREHELQDISADRIPLTEPAASWQIGNLAMDRFDHPRAGDKPRGLLLLTNNRAETVTLAGKDIMVVRRQDPATQRYIISPRPIRFSEDLTIDPPYVSTYDLRSGDPGVPQTISKGQLRLAQVTWSSSGWLELTIYPDGMVMMEVDIGPNTDNWPFVGFFVRYAGQEVDLTLPLT